MLAVFRHKFVCGLLWDQCSPKLKGVVGFYNIYTLLEKNISSTGQEKEKYYILFSINNTKVVEVKGFLRSAKRNVSSGKGA